MRKLTLAHLEHHLFAAVDILRIKIDEIVKSLKSASFVIPEKAGIQYFQ